VSQPVITASLVYFLSSRPGALALVEDALSRGLAVSMIRQGLLYRVRIMDGRGL